MHTICILECGFVTFIIPGLGMIADKCWDESCHLHCDSEGANYNNEVSSAMAYHVILQNSAVYGNAAEYIFRSIV